MLTIQEISDIVKATEEKLRQPEIITSPKLPQHLIFSQGKTEGGVIAYSAPAVVINKLLPDTSNFLARVVVDRKNATSEFVTNLVTLMLDAARKQFRMSDIHNLTFCSPGNAIYAIQGTDADKVEFRLHVEIWL